MTLGRGAGVVSSATAAAAPSGPTLGTHRKRRRWTSALQSVTSLRCVQGLLGHESVASMSGRSDTTAVLLCHFLFLPPLLPLWVTALKSHILENKLGKRNKTQNQVVLCPTCCGTAIYREFTMFSDKVANFPMQPHTLIQLFLETAT